MKAGDTKPGDRVKFACGCLGTRGAGGTRPQFLRSRDLSERCQEHKDGSVLRIAEPDEEVEAV